MPSDAGTNAGPEAGPDAESKRSSAIGRLVTLALALFLASAWLIGQGRPTLNENRDRAQLPPVTPAIAFDLGAHTAVESAIRDALPLGRVTVPLVAAAGYSAGFSLRPDVWQGGDGMLFLGDDFTNPCAPGSNVKLAALGRFLESVPANGSDLRVRFLVAPDKSTTLASMIDGGPTPDPSRPLTACQRPQWDRIKDLTHRHSRAMTIVDDSPQVAEHWQLPAYYQGDSHWTPAGAAAMSLRFGSWIAPSHPFPVDSQLGRMQVTGQLRAGGDLFRLAGLARGEAAPVVGLAVGTRPVDGPVPAIEEQADDGSVRADWTNPGAPLAGRTLILYDSFMYSAWSTVGPLFEHAVLLRTSHVDAATLRRYRGQFDHIVIQSVQRQVTARTARLYTELRDDLMATLRSGSGSAPVASWKAPDWST